MQPHDKSVNELRPAEPAAHEQTTPAITLDFVYHTVFRHKWKIVTCALLGVIAAGVVFKVFRPPFVSRAKLFIKYVEERQLPTTTESARVISATQSSTVIRTEAEILTSFDLARDVVKSFGPARLVAPDTTIDGDPSTAAAAVVYNGLIVDVPDAGSVLSIEYRHPDPGLTQPILNQIIETYLKRHAVIHQQQEGFDENLTQETDQLRARLSATEEELRRLLQQAGVVDLPAAKQAFAARIARLEEDLLSVEAATAERRAEITSFTGRPTQSDGDAIGGGEIIAQPPADQVSAYRQVTELLETLHRQEQDLLTRFTPNTPMVIGVRAQISENERTKERLERQHPQLRTRVESMPQTRSNPSPTESAFDVSAALARLSALEARRKTLAEQLGRVRADAIQLSDMEATITELQRRRELQEEQYRYLSANLERSRVDSALGPGRISNISILQAPTPPKRDSKKFKQMVIGLAASGLGLGIGLAFLIELFLDQTVKRSGEVEGTVGLPLLLSIPRRLGLGTPSASLPAVGGTLRAQSGLGEPASGGPLAQFSPGQELRPYFDALRNQLVHSFEMRNITRKPKLVAVTSAGNESGVTTVAAGLAASLSETGDGNVLLIDMNPNRASPQFFHRGNLALGIDDVLLEEKRDDALIRENLYAITPSGDQENLSWVIPKRFANLVPKLKASDYDYIIFDMAPVSQISATPQLARFMDMVLMVVESEKTNRKAARRAGEALVEAGANVAVILNKTRNVVPRLLAGDA